MRRIHLTAVAAVAAVLAMPAGAVAAPEGPYCDPGPCLDYVIERKVEQTLATLKDLAVEDVIWAVKCAGDALGGNACHQ